MLLEMRSEMDLLRREVSRVRISNSRSLGPSEAREKIQLFLDSRIPVYMIVRRMGVYGFSEDWVERAIEEIRSQKSLDLDPPVLEAT